MTIRKKRARGKKDLADLSTSAYTSTQRNQFSLAKDFDQFFSGLYPLRQGKVVYLWMSETQMPTTKKVARTSPGKRLVVLTPLQEHQAVLVSVVGRGSAVVFPKGPPRIADLVLAKVPAMYAGILTNQIRQVFKE